VISLDEAIAATRNGDVEAFGAVIKACQAYVRSFVACFVADENDVNDLAQETFVFAYEHLKEYEMGTNFLAWLKAIARNKVMSFQRSGRQKRESRRQYVADRLVQRAVDLSPDFSEERVRALSRCIEQLPKEQRTFLTSVLGREGTLREWSSRADMAADTVRKRVSRLYGVLRDCIEHRLAAGGRP
jgi:RNA polymerase sigma-70 factor (ECF subfamily)